MIDDQMSLVVIDGSNEIAVWRVIDLTTSIAEPPQQTGGNARPIVPLSMMTTITSKVLAGAPNMVELHLMAQGIGLGVWSTIATLSSDGKRVSRMATPK